MSSAYTTQAAIQGSIQSKDLIACTDDAPAQGAINTTILNQVIANASGVIDMYCANIYGQQIPFNPVPPSVAQMALTIACYMLFERREVPKELNKFTSRYNFVMSFLAKVNTGDAHISDVTLRDFPQGALTSQATIYGNQPFSGGNLVNSM
jgi:phage gp36-like protein